MLRRILVALDESTYCDSAIELAIRWALRFDALVVGLGIIDQLTICRPQPVPIGGGSFKRQRDSELLADAHRRVEELLKTFMARCTERGVRCQILEIAGDPSQQILEQSKIHDLIVTGKQTNFHFETQDEGDATVWQLLYQASRPVVTTPHILANSERTLVAYDGSAAADRALQAFQALGLAGEGKVHVLSVGSDDAESQRRAEQAANFLKSHDIPAVAHVRAPVGSVAQTILAEAHDLEAGLLVMGARGQAWWRELMFGSTTYGVLESSPIPVLFCH